MARAREACRARFTRPGRAPQRIEPESSRDGAGLRPPHPPDFGERPAAQPRAALPMLPSPPFARPPLVGCSGELSGRDIMRLLPSCAEPYFAGSGAVPSLCSTSVIVDTTFPSSSTTTFTGGPGSFFAKWKRRIPVFSPCVTVTA